MHVRGKHASEREGPILLVDVQVKGVPGTGESWHEEQWARESGVDCVFDHHDLRGWEFVPGLGGPVLSFNLTPVSDGDAGVDGG